MSSIVPYISLGISVLAIGVSVYCFRLTQRRAIRPVLVFSHDGRGDMGASGWEVENAGPGPAVNVLLAAGCTQKVWKQDTALLLPALGAGSKFRLTWIRHPGALLAIYADSEGREYTCTCVHSRNQIVSANQYPEMKPVRFAYQLKNDQVVG